MRRRYGANRRQFYKWILVRRASGVQLAPTAVSAQQRLPAGVSVRYCHSNFRSSIRVRLHLYVKEWSRSFKDNEASTWHAAKVVPLDSGYVFMANGVGDDLRIQVQVTGSGVQS